MEESSSDSPTRRFTNRVDDYVKARPRYPQAVLETLHKQVGFDSSWTISDIGSGTGISAELFLDNGNEVFAVEPNNAMRAAAEGLLSSRAKFHSIGGTAAATSLPARSVDLVVAAQAFHWFDISAFRGECQRILRPGGWALIMWNDRLLAGTPFLEAYEALLQRFATDYKTVNHQNIGQDKLTQFFGRPPALVELPNEQTLDLEGIRSRLLSSSYVPPTGHERHEPMLAELRRQFDAHQQNGAVKLLYRTQMFFGQLS